MKGIEDLDPIAIIFAGLLDAGRPYFDSWARERAVLPDAENGRLLRHQFEASSIVKGPRLSSSTGMNHLAGIRGKDEAVDRESGLEQISKKGSIALVILILSSSLFGGKGKAVLNRQQFASMLADFLESSRYCGTSQLSCRQVISHLKGIRRFAFRPQGW